MDKTPEDKTPEDKTPEKSGPWDKNPELIFRGWTEPQTFLHLLFMEFILFKIVKSVVITRRCSACYKIYFVVSQG